MSEAQQFYQAIGELFATLVITNDGTKFLEMPEARYRAFMPLKVEKRYQEKYLGQQVYWRVYPQFSEQGLSFKIVSLAEQPKRGHGQFVLQGDWVEAGQLQIWRNPDASRVNQHNWQPRLLPIDWQNPPLPDASFWQLQAELVDGVFKVMTAQGPFPQPPRLEKLPESQWRPQRSGPASSQPQLKPRQAITESISWEELTPVSGKLELTIKFNTLPQVKQVDGRCHFKVDCDGRVFQVTMKQKQWSKLETASTTYAQWVAALSGKLGAATSDGFVLEEPNIQVFERSAKQEQAKESDAGTQVQSSATELPLKTTKVKVASEASSSQQKTQTLEVTTTESRPTPPEQSDPQAQSSTPKAKSKPKQLGKFNVEIR